MTAPRLVFLRPRNADNLGAIARAMKNFGLNDWVVVTPNPKLLEAPGLHQLAVKSGDLLETVRLVDSIEAAVADCSWVVGTTMRVIDGRRRLTPRELTAAVAERPADERWALVFGDERSGMTTDDIRACHALSFIPSSDEQPSLNLAQAVVVYGYELAMGRRATGPAPGPALADDMQLRTVRSALDAGLTKAGFWRGDDRRALDDLMRVLQRSQLSKKEASLWTAVMKTVAKKADYP